MYIEEIRSERFPDNKALLGAVLAVTTAQLVQSLLWATHLLSMGCLLCRGHAREVHLAGTETPGCSGAAHYYASRIGDGGLSQGMIILW